MGWSFAIVNGKLAEIFFDKNKKGFKVRSHCYVERNEYKTKKEQNWIDEDIARVKVIWRKGKYKVTIKPAHRLL